jgi:hypothetical protein
MRCFPFAPFVLLSTLVLQAAWAPPAHAQTELHLTVPAAQSDLCLAVKAQAPDQTGVLVDLGNPELRVPVQWVPAIAEDGTKAAEQLLLLTQIPPSDQVDQPRKFRWEPAAADSEIAGPALRWVDKTEASVKVLEGDQPVLVYNHGDVVCDRLPEDDLRRRRSCYIHPLWGLNGEVLTDDFPPDHVHHHGVFWTWPHVEIDGQHYDLWVSRGIRQRFLKWLYRETGPVAAVVGVENGWFVGDRQVMTERIWIRAFRASETERAIDLELVFSPTDQPVKLVGSPGKSYGGLTVRFDVWPRRDAVVRVPQRTVRHVGSGLASSEDLSNTRLPWASLSSHFPDAPHRSAGSILIPPDHPDFPPTWLTRCYGPLCVGWPGEEGREFQPGESFTLRYRLLLHKTEVEHETLERAYAAYCESLGVTAE